MAHVSDSEITFDDMSSTDLISVMKKMMTALQKKTKKMETCVVKAEEKKAKAAPVKGVRPPQLAQNAEWVNFVHSHILANGWETFVHAERLGKGMADVEYPPSTLVALCDANGQEQTDEDGETVMIHVFDGSESEQPNLAHAMTISKAYRVSKPELYQEFLTEYVPDEPVAVVAPAKPVVERVTMTLAERREERERVKTEKEEEKEEKKRIREEKKAATALAKVEADAAKALLKGPKAPPKGAVIRAPVPVKAAMMGAVPVRAKPVAVAAAAVAAALKPIAKLVKKPTVWVRPEKGQMLPFMYAGVTYMRDHLDRLFDDADDCVGVFLESTKKVSQEAEDIPEDE